MKFDKQSKIAVLLGGDSKEREISLATGGAILKALQTKGYSQAQAIDPSETPEFYKEAWDAVFIALHGKGGEDGTMQKLLEEHNIAYTGSRSKASQLSMSKNISKQIFQKHEIPTLPFVVSHQNETFAIVEEKIREKLTFPIIGKPDLEGSSIGMQIVPNVEGLKGAWEKAHQFGSEILWENYLQNGIDLTVGILQDTALPVIEIRPKSGLYDYESKYTKGKTDYYCPARIPDELASRLQSYALKAFQAVGCSGWGRVDFIWVDNLVYCLEINTVPGMTATSLVPMAAKQINISFEDLVETILQDAC